MSLGEIPPVRETPSNIPSSKTREEMAALAPAVRNVHLYERTLEDFKIDRDEYKAKVRELEAKIGKDKSFEVKLTDLQGRYDEAISQHCFTTLFAGFGALGLSAFSKTDDPGSYWVSAAVAGVGVFFGIATKPLAWLVRRWTSRRKS